MATIFFIEIGNTSSVIRERRHRLANSQAPVGESKEDFATEIFTPLVAFYRRYKAISDDNVPKMVLLKRIDSAAYHTTDVIGRREVRKNSTLVVVQQLS